MSDNFHDIKDDEIRVIRQDNNPAGKETIPGQPGGSPKRITIVLLIAVCLTALIAIAYFVFGAKSQSSELLLTTNEEAAGQNTVTGDSIPAAQTHKAYVEIADTTVNGSVFSIFTPRYGTASLQIGADALTDSTAKFVVQAADIRRDNGEIVGAFVSKGQLLSKGQAKAGFCAIIGGKPVIGIADATPYLEQAIETDGYFFRQYPLVVGGQIVENKPQNASLRKALAELDGQIVVIMSHSRMTFHDFSQALVDLGVSNAIYLVGSIASGFAVDADGKRVNFGKENPLLDHFPANANFLVWR